MIKSISKPKIQRGYVYVLKTGQLEKLLADNNIDIHVYLVYWRPQTNSIFEVHYWFPNQNVEYERLYIRAGALPKEDVPLAREKLETIVFPKFVEWITDMLAQPDNSTKLDNDLYFNAIYKNKGLELIVR